MCRACHRVTRRPGQLGRHQKTALRRIEKAARGRSGGKRVWTVGYACAVCAEPFVRAGQASPYCSKACSAVAKRGWIEPRLRYALYARDGWVCQLCFEPVPHDVKPTDEQYATLDHIIPRSRGGSDDPSNLRLAHLGCNGRRGAPALDFALAV